MSYPKVPPYEEYSSKPPPMGFSSPPPMYYPPPQVIPSAPAMTSPPVVFGPESITLDCPHCHCRISTVTSKNHATCTHCCCLCLFCTIGFSLFSCLPYFFCDPASVEHTCPNCKVKLGEWRND